jgi:hypothetical protein
MMLTKCKVSHAPKVIGLDLKVGANCFIQWTTDGETDEIEAFLDYVRVRARFGKMRWPVKHEKSPLQRTAEVQGPRIATRFQKTSTSSQTFPACLCG